MNSLTLCSTLLLVLAIGFVEAKQAQQTLAVKVERQDTWTYNTYVQAKIGTPAQSLNLAVDLFSTTTLAVDKDAEQKCADGSQLPSTFDYSVSSTYKLVNNYTNDNYTNNFLSEDLFQLGSNAAQKLQFNVTNVYPSEWECSPNAGSLGLGVVRNEEDTFAGALLKDYPQQVVTVSLDKKASASAQDPQLSLTLGGHDGTACSTSWTEIKCLTKSEFTYPGCTFDVDGYIVGDYKKKSRFNAYRAAISLQPITYVPQDVYDRLLRTISVDEETGGILCNSNHPDVGFIVNGQDFTVEGKWYVGKRLDNNYCEFLLKNGITGGFEKDIFILPLGFYSRTCQQLDFSKTSTLLAAAK